MPRERITAIISQKKIVLPLLAVALLALAVTSAIYGQSSVCRLSLLPGDHVVADAWTGDCQSEVAGRGYARYYTFFVSEPSVVTITLDSQDANPFLYLRSGDATSGEILAENDDYPDGNTEQSHIVAGLDVGSYTIEATTYEADGTGEFKLTVTGIPDIEELDIPTPTPTPHISISTANSHVCVLSNSGRVKCQPVETEGRIAPPEGQVFVAIASGDVHTCGLTGDGYIICWGELVKFDIPIRPIQPVTSTLNQRGEQVKLNVTLWTTQPVTSTLNQHSILNVDESGAVFGPWVLSLGCTRNGKTGAFLRRTTGDVFGGVTENKQLHILTEIGDIREKQAWYLITPDEHYAAYLSHGDGNSFVQRLLEAESLRITLHYDAGLSVVSFNTGGLDQKIDRAEDVCTARQAETQSGDNESGVEQLQGDSPALRGCFQRSFRRALTAGA